MRATHHLDRHRPGAGPALLATLRGLAASAMVLGTLAVGATAAGAQSDEDAGTYQAPDYDYSIEWDADTWSVANELDATESGNDRDFLQLADADATTQLFVEGAEGEFRDTDDCVETLFPELNVDPSDGEAVRGFEDSSDTRSQAAYVFPADANGTQDATEPVDLDLTVFAVCVADPDSDLVVAFSGRSGITDDWDQDGYGLIEPIIDSLPFAAGGDAGQDEDATPEADRDETPVAEDGDETPEADRDETPTADSGVDGDLYTAPDYAFQVEFDQDTWSVDDEVADGDVNSLVLSTSFEVDGTEYGMRATVTGFNDRAGIDGCTDAYLDIIDARSDGAQYVTDDDGDPLVSASDDGSQVSAYYLFQDGGDPYASFVSCVDLGGDDLLAVEFTTAPEVLTSDEANALVSDLLAGVAFASVA